MQSDRPVRFLVARKKILWMVGLPLVTGTYALAQISVGPVITFDPTVAAKIISETIEVVKVASATLQTYEQLKMEAQFLQNKYVWRGAIFAGVDSYFNSTPVTSPWAVAAMKGIGAARGYGQAAVTLQSNPRMIVMGDPRAPFYANAQIGAANNTVALQTLGNARVFTSQMVQPVQNCETTALATDANSNTDAAQQNISNACQVLALRHQQAVLNVETARLGIELAQSKMQTDSLADYQNMLTRSEQPQSGLPGNLYQTEQNYRPK